MRSHRDISELIAALEPLERDLRNSAAVWADHSPDGEDIERIAARKLTELYLFAEARRLLERLARIAARLEAEPAGERFISMSELEEILNGPIPRKVDPIAEL